MYDKTKGFDTKKSLNVVSSSPFDQNVFYGIKNGSRWMRIQENMVDVLKSHIPSQCPSVVSSWQHSAKHCPEAKLSLVAFFLTEKLSVSRIFPN